MTLSQLEELARAATAGPWKACGDILQDRAAVRTATKDLFCSYDKMSMDTANDMRFIAAFRNHAETLLQIASYAKSLLAEEGAFEAISHFNVAFGLKDALANLESIK